jgi:predicted nucleic acid-binding protein
MIVVDANLLVRFHLEGESGDRAREAARREAWAAPALWRSEFCSAMLRLIRAGEISREQALEYYGTCEQLLWGRTFSVRHEKALELAAGSDASSYDSEYVALANDLGLKLLTLDRPLIHHFPGTAIHLDEYCA